MFTSEARQTASMKMKMTMLMTYLPEWKIYLWRKLLLEEESNFNDPILLTRFVFFTEIEQRQETRKRLLHSIDSLNNAKNAALVTRSPMLIADGNHTSHTDAYYSSYPKKVGLALIELAESDPVAIKIEKINLKKGDKNKDVTVSELKEFLTPSSDVISFEYLQLKIKLDKKALEKRLGTYLDAFREGALLAGPDIRYYFFEKQKEDITRSLQNMAKKYGNKNITFTLDELAKKGGWYQRDERNYRPFETLFTLEKLGELEIHDLRKHEIILSLKKYLSAETKQSAAGPSIQKSAIESIKSITFISENKKADKVSSFYINHHIHDVHKMQRLSGEVRKLARVAAGEEVPFEKQTHDYINTNKNCVLYRNGKYKLTKIIDGHSRPLKISRGIEVEIIDDKVFKRRLAAADKNSA